MICLFRKFLSPEAEQIRSSVVIFPTKKGLRSPAVGRLSPSVRRWEKPLHRAPSLMAEDGDGWLCSAMTSMAVSPVLHSGSDTVVVGDYYSFCAFAFL